MCAGGNAFIRVHLCPVVGGDDPVNDVVINHGCLMFHLWVMSTRHCRQHDTLALTKRLRVMERLLAWTTSSTGLSGQHGASARLDNPLPCRHRKQTGPKASPPTVLWRRWRESCWNGGHEQAAGRLRTDVAIHRRRAGFSQIYRPARRRRGCQPWRPTRLLVGGTSHRPAPAVGDNWPWRHLPAARHVLTDVRNRRSSRAVSK